MSVDSRHPDWDANIDDWTMMRDCEGGERTVKNKGVAYLPMPEGFTAQSDSGLKMYSAYQIRAQYPDILQPTLMGMVGVIHRVEAEITGLEEGKPLAGLWEKATKDGMSLETFHRRITKEILLMGRYSILTDVPSEGDGMPYFAGYDTEMLINWANVDRDLFVLNETRKVLADDGFTWIDEPRYRVLRLVDGKYTVNIYKGTEESAEPINPQAKGAKQFDQIPMVVVGPRDLSIDFVVQPPLIGVAKAALAIYRLDADYRHQLFNSGQETLVLVGEIETLPRVVGSGVIIGMPAGSDAKYVGPSGVGITAHRQAILDERQNAVAAGVRLFDTQAKAESGDALRLRASAQTATLTTIAQASAAALEKSLRYAAMFVGQDPDEIVVKPNLQFVDTKMPAADAAQLVTVWQGGAISKQTLYENLQRGEIASAERTYEEEQELIDQEAIDHPQIDPNTGLPAPQPGAAPHPQLLAGPGGGGRSQVPSRFVETGSGLQIEAA